MPQISPDELRIPEQWLPVVGFDGIYEVSSLGRVMRLDAPRKNGYHHKGGLMKLRANRSGYLIVDLSGTIHVTRLVSRLVCEAFHGSAPADFEAAHIDGNRTNNTKSNLKWCSRMENLMDKIHHGSIVMGDRHKGSKLRECQIPSIRIKLAAGMPIVSIAREFGVGHTAIDRIAAGVTWKHVPALSEMEKK